MRRRNRQPETLPPAPLFVQAKIAAASTTPEEQARQEQMKREEEDEAERLMAERVYNQEISRIFGVKEFPPFRYAANFHRMDLSWCQGIRSSEVFGYLMLDGEDGLIVDLSFRRKGHDRWCVWLAVNREDGWRRVGEPLFSLAALGRGIQAQEESQIPKDVS